MSETKWTPGPWEVFFDDCAACGGEWIIRGPASGEHGQFCNEFDARLISSAPDMAESLRAAANLLAALTGPDDDIACFVISAARAALAKARGEA